MIHLGSLTASPPNAEIRVRLALPRQEQHCATGTVISSAVNLKSIFSSLLAMGNGLGSGIVGRTSEDQEGNGCCTLILQPLHHTNKAGTLIIKTDKARYLHIS